MGAPADPTQRVIDFWRGISPELRRAGAGIALAAAALMAWQLLYTPLLTAVAVQRARLTELQGKIADAHLLAGQAVAQHAALDEARAAFQRLRRRIGEGQTVGRVIEVLGRQAKQHKLELMTIQPDEDEESPRLLAVEGGVTVREVPVSLRVRGRYQQIGQFLAALSNAPCLASVRQVSLSRPSRESPQLQAEMVLTVYLEEPSST
jgi:Tfp pilus assembly protein PilO